MRDHHSSSKNHREKDRPRSREKDRPRSREKDRPRSPDRNRQRSRDRVRERSRDRSKDRSRERHKERNRGRSRDRRKSRDRKSNEHKRDNYRARYKRSRSKSYDKRRPRSRSADRDRKEDDSNNDAHHKRRNSKEDFRKSPLGFDEAGFGNEGKYSHDKEKQARDNFNNMKNGTHRTASNDQSDPFIQADFERGDSREFTSSMNDIKNAYSRDNAAHATSGRKDTEAFLTENRGLLQQSNPHKEETALRKNNSKEAGQHSDPKKDNREVSRKAEARQDANRFLASMNDEKEDENPFLQHQESQERQDKQPSVEQNDRQALPENHKIDLRSRIPLSNVASKPRESILQRLIKKPA